MLPAGGAVKGVMIPVNDSGDASGGITSARPREFNSRLVKGPFGLFFVSSGPLFEFDSVGQEDDGG